MLLLRSKPVAFGMATEPGTNAYRDRPGHCSWHNDAVVADAPQRRWQSARVTRLICLLRGHGLVKKVAKTHRYQVTAKGRSAITTLLAARQADTAKLTEAA